MVKRRSYKCGKLKPISTAAIFVISLFLNSGLLAENTGSISLVVVSGRALNNSLIILEKSLGCLITCEEAPRRSPQEITELFLGGPRVLVSRKIEFKYKAASPPQMVIESLLNQYNQQYGDASYTVVKAFGDENIFNVFPVDWKDADGCMVKHKSAFATPISISVKPEDSLSSFFVRVFDSISSPYEPRISLSGPMPRNPMGLSNDFTAKPALFCMNEVMDTFRNLPGMPSMSWSLRRGPRLGNLYSFAFFAMRKVDIDPPAGDFFISIEAEKPLATAVRILEKALSCIISYEDHEYVFERDMFLNKAKEPQMLSGDILRFAFKQNDDKEKIIHQMLAGFRRYGVFDVARVSEDHFAVYPTLSYDQKGELKPVNALSKKALSLSINNKTLPEALAVYARTLEQETSKRVTLAEPPKSLAEGLVSFTTTQEPVMKSLTGLLQSVDRQISWQIKYGVKSKEYSIDIHRVGDL